MSITKAERIHGVPAHHNAWAVTYDCGHTVHVSLKKDAPEPYAGNPAVHAGCPGRVAAPEPFAAPEPPTEAPEVAARRELIDVARALLKVANARLTGARATTARPASAPTEEEMQRALQPSIVLERMEKMETAAATFAFYYLGRDGALREEISEDCFRGRDEDNLRHSGYYAVEAQRAGEPLKRWIAVVRRSEQSLRDNSADHEDDAARIAQAAAACFRAATASA